jgi:hypothetical protein
LHFMFLLNEIMINWNTDIKWSLNFIIKK